MIDNQLVNVSLQSQTYTIKWFIWFYYQGDD